MHNPSRRRVLSGLLTAALALSACASKPRGDLRSPAYATTQTTAATPAVVAGKYLAVGDIDIRALLPDPPAAGSPLARAEIELVLALHADASPQAKARALAEDNMTPWLFADVLGPSFNPGDLPLTAKLLAHATADCRAVSDHAKAIWSRPRPFEEDQRVTARTELPGNHSYPSGHATRAAMWSRVLSRLDSRHADAIAARARLIGSDRIVAGVHFPSDIVAGFVLGNAVADRLLENPAFVRDLEAASAEWHHAPSTGAATR